MAHKKGAGSTDNGRDSAPQYLGVKKFGGEHVLAGNILVRQKGTKFHPGVNTYLGKDHTLHAKIEGIVGFKKVADSKRIVFVLPMGSTTTTATRAAIVADPVAIAAKKAAIESAAQAKAATLKAKAEVEHKAAEAVVKVAPVASVEVAPATVTVASEPTETVSPTTVEKAHAETNADDLKKIEGIGPKIAELLHADGIHTFAQLAATSADRVKEILHAAGPRYQMHNPETWGQQAAMAAEGKWAELKKWQDEMDGGRA